MTMNHQASLEPGKTKFSDLLAHPEVRQRWEKVRKYFFLRESTYDMSNRCNLQCDGCYYYEGEKQFAVENNQVEAWRGLMRSEKERGITYVVLAGAEPSLVPELLEVCFQELPLGSIATNGFDLGGVGTGDISVASSGCDNNWTVASVTAGTASADHLIQINRSTNSCAASSTITVTVGDASNKLINPAPISTGHTQGAADVYTLNVKTRDGSDNTLDQSNIKVAVIEGVLVSATVEETLAVTIAGVASTTSACGATTDVTTTATSVPWGTISSFGAFKEAAQTVTVSTNADAGYSVKAEENDQMGKDGIACTGATAGESVNCIQDTLCGTVSCSESAGYYWTSTAKYGLGFTLANASGTDASFLYDSTSEPCTTTGGGTSTNFCARQFADQETPETKQTIMSNAGPVASSQVSLCYRLNVSATQPAGYYFNKVQLTATATF